MGVFLLSLLFACFACNRNSFWLWKGSERYSNLEDAVIQMGLDFVGVGTIR
jgi:hypothetical protein